MLGDNIPKIRSGGGVEGCKLSLLCNPLNFAFFPEACPQLFITVPSLFGKCGFSVCQWWSGWRSTFYCASKQSSCCFKIPVGCGWYGYRRGESVYTVKASWYSGRKSLLELLDPSRAGELNLFCAIEPCKTKTLEIYKRKCIEIPGNKFHWDSYPKQKHLW